MTKTLELMIDRYGILMTTEQLSEVLHRSPEALRITLSNNRSEWARKINAAKLQWGRRVLFRTVQISLLIDQNPIE